jgi:fibronectin type 3 domain-containing protein
MTTCSFRITFAPAQDGLSNDTVRIQTNAWNGYGGFVRIPVSGIRISTPAPPNLVIQVRADTTFLSWNAVIHSINGCPAQVSQYRIYTAQSEDGHYSFLTATTDTSFARKGVGAFQRLFYRVTAQTP